MALTGHDKLKELGIEIIPASAPDYFTEDTPTAVLVRQVLGAIAQFEKASAVAKLAAARALGLRVVPWTVNDPADMASLIDLGVDGLITDYPDRARAVMAEKGLPLPRAFPAE